MNLRTVSLALAAIVTTSATLMLGGCYNPRTGVEFAEKSGKDYYRELPPGAYALRKITDPRMIPDFTSAFEDTSELDRAVTHSIRYMNKPSSKTFFPMSGISHQQVLDSLTEFKALLQQGGTPAELNKKLRETFDVYISVGCDDQGTVLFTGYYTPIFDASLTQTGEFKHPLYKLPPNHVKDPITGETKGRKRSDGTIDPNYPDRAGLMASGELKGLELVWFKDPVEAYVVSVQGSAILKLPNGKQMEIGYAGTNGHDYSSIGMALVKAGKLKREELNLKRIMDYFKANPADFDKYANLNKRYIFFQEASGGPFGTLNERVLARRSIATDKSIFPRGSICFIDTTLPNESGSQRPFKGFVCDQDAGGAIRAPGRCDVFMGVGDEAGRIAGRTMAEGRMYYLIKKDAKDTPRASLSK